MPVEIYPVVHITDGTDAEELSKQQARLAAEHGAKGLFLIDHHSSEVEMLLRCFNAASEALPDLYLGINFLQLSSAYDSFQQLLEWKTTDRISKMPNGLGLMRHTTYPRKPLSSGVQIPSCKLSSISEELHSNIPQGLLMIRLQPLPKQKCLSHTLTY